MGLTTDLNLKGSEFSTAIAVLFAGYICFQLPANMCTSTGFDDVDC